MRVLILDHKIDLDSRGSQDLVRLTLQASSNQATVFVRRPVEMDLPAQMDSFDYLILSGSKTSASDQSPWVLALDHFLKRWVDSGKPVLGICYGHQSLIRVLGGLKSVGDSKVPEYGWTEVVRVHPKAENEKPSRLLEGVSENFCTYSSHREEVKFLPNGFRVTAMSKDCEIQAFESESAPIFGVQFHPERTLEEGKRDLIKKKVSKTKPSKNFDPHLGRIIVNNFLKVKG